MSLEIQINNDIKAAMLAKEKDKLEALRAVKAAILIAKTEKAGTDQLSPDMEIKLLQKLVKQRKESAAIYKQNNRMDLYDKEVMEAGIIEVYLPKQISSEELESEIKSIISELGASGIKDMGKVMSQASKTLGGKAVGKEIADKVKELLS